ncbi:D-aminoacylase [subsurface metagenome]
MASSFDLVIKGGRVIDGTGNPWFKKDIGISEGKIKRVGYIAEDAKQTIDATGMIVSPGFVDLHTHTDFGILAYPNAESHLMQGVTTVVTGNCGLSLAPINPDNLALLRRYLSPFFNGGYDYQWEWKTLAEYYEKVERQGISPNVAPLVGQGTVRLAVKGFDSSRTSREEMNEMKRLIAQSLEGGAFGMSTGLIYPPGSYSSTEELIELASVLRKYGAIYTTHIRDEGNRLMESVEEAIAIGEKGGIPVEISHHKASGRSNWGKVNATLKVMEQARQRGIEINCDVYPYTASSTTITAILPTWLLEGGVEEMLGRLKDDKTRELLKQEIVDGTMTGANTIKDADWHSIFIGRCPSREKYEGKSLGQIMEEGQQFDNRFEGFLDLLLEIEGNATMVAFSMSEDDVRTVMSNPLSSFISDSWSTAPSAGGKPHPRGYGTFPRVLGKYVREENLLTLEAAIRKMTSLPAGKIGLENRGIIKEGFWADVVIFDPTTIRDEATFADPHQYPEGIHYVMVNGAVVADHGRVTGVRPGKVLRR